MARFILPKRIYKKESDVKKTIKEILIFYKLYYFMPIASGYSGVGTPDFVGILPNGVFLGIETKCKSTCGKVSEAQKQAITCINSNNGKALVIDESRFELLIDIIETVKNKKDING